MAKALTATFVQNVPAGPRRREIPDGLLPGFYLIAQPSGVKSWAVRYRFGRQTRKLTLGRYPEITLATARELARNALQSVAEGCDPGEKTKASDLEFSIVVEIGAILFSTAVEEFLSRYVRENNKPSSAKEAERLLRKNVVPEWTNRTLQSISKSDVLNILDAIVKRGARVSANRTLAALRRMFNWCIERGLLESSPCDRLKAPTSERGRDRVLDDQELSRILISARGLGWPFGPFVELLAYTGQRRNEVSGMRWRELDASSALWTIPSERSKNGRAHEVPLSSGVLRLLESLPRIASNDDFVFSTTTTTPISGFSRAKSTIDQKMTGRGIAGSDKSLSLANWTFHDLRRTTASGMARLGVALPVIEKLLNHTSGSFAGVVGVYQRYSYLAEKRVAMELWGKALDALLERPVQ